MRRAPSFLALALLLSLAAPARGQVPGEEIARRAFEEGVALEKKGDYTGALGKFRESAQIKGTLGNRFHTAFCLEMTGKLVAALLEYEAVEKTAREQSKADVLEATRVRLEPLLARVPQLGIRATAPKDATVTLDESPLAAALLDGKPFRVEPGEHVVAARAPGHRDFTKRVVTADGSTMNVEIVLERASTDAPHPNAGPHPIEEPTVNRTPAIATTGGAVALAIAGVAFFLAADGAHEDAEKTCPARIDCDDERSKVRTFDALSLASFIGAAGLGALSIVLWTAKGPRRSATITGRPAWLGLEGRF